MAKYQRTNDSEREQKLEEQYDYFVSCKPMEKNSRRSRIENNKKHKKHKRN